MLSVGARLADYEIVAPLREGGMATLFLARKRGAAGFSRYVAIKVVRPSLAQDEELIEMFLDEARLCSHIHHPNVVHVEELGVEEGLYYIVMEYVHGCSLAQLLTALSEGDRRATQDVAVHIAIKMAEGLHAAHEAIDERGRSLGVVHRDVSPQNVLLSYAGHVKIIDFGIAKARSRSQGSRRALKGKVAYMSPEQAYGRPVDRRTDIYALGVILWEMLTMQRLFAAQSSLLLLEKVRKPKVAAPSTVEPSLTTKFDDAIMWALQPNPRDRPATALELSQRIAEAAPSAAAVQPSRISELLRALLADDIRQEQERLPEGVTETLVGVDSSEWRSVETLQTMTVSAGATTWFTEQQEEESRTPRGVAVEETPILRDEAVRRSRWPAVLGAIGLVGLGAAVALGIAGLDQGTAVGPASATPVEGPEPVAVEEAPPPEPIIESPATEPDAGAVEVVSADDVEENTSARDRRAALRAQRAQQRRERERQRDMASAMMIDGVTIVSDWD